MRYNFKIESQRASYVFCYKLLISYNLRSFGKLKICKKLHFLPKLSGFIKCNKIWVVFGLIDIVLSFPNSRKIDWHKLRGIVILRFLPNFRKYFSCLKENKSNAISYYSIVSFFIFSTSFSYDDAVCYCTPSIIYPIVFLLNHAEI